MPMDFPTLKTLEFAAKTHKFRDPLPGESEDEFREALADHVKPIDRIEAFEIRTGKGWDKWTDDEKETFLFG